MTYSTDREPLLRKEEGEDDLKPLVEMFEFYCANPTQFYYVRKERFIPRAVFFVVGIVCFLSAIDQYNIAMKEVEARECSDVLSSCDKVPFNSTLLPPYYNYLEDFTITRRYDISFCLIPKVLSTIGTAALCYIDNPVAFSDGRRTIANESYDDRFCEKNEMKSFEQVKFNLNKKFDNIIVVRDPFDRFISGFTEKCVYTTDYDLCHGCGANIRCFLRKEYRRLMRITMLFPVYTLADTHFAPQTWFCDMKNTIANSTVIRYSNVGSERKRMIDDIVGVFRKNSVPEKDIWQVRKELSKGKTQHSTAGTSVRHKYEKMVREDVAIRRAIVRMYYHDFQILGYPM